MSDWLQVSNAAEINLSHINNKNCDGYSTIIVIKKQDGTQTQITAYSKTKIKHTKNFDEDELFQEEQI